MVKPSKNHTSNNNVTIAVLLLLAIGIFGFIFKIQKDANSTPTSNSLDTQQSQVNAESKVPGMGEAARDGSFEFKITDFKCGETTVGDQYYNKTAQGHFCRLSITVKNIGTKPQSLFSVNQDLIDSLGREFASDSSATIAATTSGADSVWAGDVNPGNSISGDVIFDTPTDATMVTAVLHDSAFSGGVKVSLQ